MQLAAALWEEPLQFSGAWNFGPSSDSHRSVKELAAAVLKYWGAGTLSFEPDSSAPRESGFLHLNCDKVRNYLGWEAVWDFQDAVRETVAWYKAVDKERESVRQLQKFLIARKEK